MLLPETRADLDVREQERGGGAERSPRGHPAGPRECWWADQASVVSFNAAISSNNPEEWEEHLRVNLTACFSFRCTASWTRRRSPAPSLSSPPQPRR